MLRAQGALDVTRNSGPRPLLLGVGWFPDHPGGLNRYFRDLLSALSDRGVTAQAVVIGPVADPSFTKTQVSCASDGLVVRVRRFAHAAESFSEITDVVDAHFALYAFVPALLGRLRHHPLVVHFQGPWAEESASAGESRTWVLSCKRWIEGAVYRRAREVVVLSGAFKRILVEQYHVLPWRIHVIPPGVDLKHFCPGPVEAARAELDIADDAWLCVAVRRLVPRMGLDVLLDAWGLLVEDRRDLILLIGGEGAGRGGLEAQARDLGIADSVRFVGRLSEQELLAAYRAADLCVVPSVALEGFGLVVLEALASGTPVIASDVGGLPEALSRLDRSLVVPAGDAPVLAARLAGAVDGHAPMPDEKECRKYAEKFSWETVAERTLAIYRQAIEVPAPTKLRVIYLDHYAGLSGGEIALSRLLPALQDVEAHVVLAQSGPLVSHLVRAGISVEVMPLSESARTLHRDRVRPGGLPVRAIADVVVHTARLAHRLHRLHPDIVHTNSLKSAVYGGIAGRIAGIPVIWHMRDRIEDDYLPRPAVRLIRALARRLPNAVICNSESTMQTLPNLHRAAVHRSPMPIYDAVPAGRGSRDLWPGAEDGEGPCVGMVGRLAPWKGQHVFVKAFARAFPPEGPNGGARAVIVGAPLFGEEVYEGALKDLVSQVGLDGRLDFVGFTEDVGEHLARFDILVHASVIPEPFGLVVIEGMAAGLPVVASSGGGPSEVIEDGVTGVLYPPGDVDSLAGVLKALAGDAALRRRLGDAARSKAKEFAPEVIASQVMAVYRQVLAS